MNEHRGKILRLPPNRVWRTYAGGLMLDRMEHRELPADGPFPEDWIGSTVRAINPNGGKKDEGLSWVSFPGGQALLADLIAVDSEYFLGSRHLSCYGTNPMLLVKYLDAAVRLPFQVHPTLEFSRKYLHADSGKTEAYYILSTREEVAEPYIYLGFQRHPSRAELRRMIVEQDIAALERCFDKITVKASDVYVVPGGLPHAIGEGVLMVEIMEPTDFVARVEFNVSGRVIPESARFMGRDVEFALDMFSLDAATVATVQAQWRCQPRILEKRPNLVREALVDGRLTDRFNVLRTVLTGPNRWHPSGFTILIVVEGSCTLATAHELVHLEQFDRIAVPQAMGSLEITGTDSVTLLECLPPSPAR